MSRDYDLIDLWFEHGERLPPDLAGLALEMLLEDPSRIEASRGSLESCRKGVIDAVVHVWKTRLPTTAEVEAIANIFAPISKQLPQGEEHTEEVILRDAPLVYFIVQFTKKSRTTALFSQSFKLVNSVLMPYIVRCFPAQKK